MKCGHLSQRFAITSGRLNISCTYRCKGNSTSKQMKNNSITSIYSAPCCEVGFHNNKLVYMWMCFSIWILAIHRLIRFSICYGGVPITFSETMITIMTSHWWGRTNWFHVSCTWSTCEMNHCMYEQSHRNKYWRNLWRYRTRLTWFRWWRHQAFISEPLITSLHHI